MQTCLITDDNVNPDFEAARAFTWRLPSSELDARRVVLRSAEVIVILCLKEFEAALQLVAHVRSIIEKDVGLILILASLDESQRVRALNEGADCTEIIGVKSATLYARMRSLDRRRQFNLQRYKTFEAIELDLESYKLKIHGQLIPVTKTEFRIVALLVQHQTEIVTRDVFEAAVFQSYVLGRRSLDVHICAIRRKFAPFNYAINSHRMQGYRISSSTRCKLKSA